MPKIWGQNEGLNVRTRVAIPPKIPINFEIKVFSPKMK